MEKHAPGTAFTREKRGSGSSSSKMEGLCVAAGYRSLSAAHLKESRTLFFFLPLSLPRNLINNSAGLRVMKCHLFQLCAAAIFISCSVEMFIAEAGIKADEFLCSATITVTCAGDTLISDSKDGYVLNSRRVWFFEFVFKLLHFK